MFSADTPGVTDLLDNNAPMPTGAGPGPMDLKSCPIPRRGRFEAQGWVSVCYILGFDQAGRRKAPPKNPEEQEISGQTFKHIIMNAHTNSSYRRVGIPVPPRDIP